MKNETNLKMNEILNSAQLFRDANLEIMTNENMATISGGSGHIHISIGNYSICIRWD